MTMQEFGAWLKTWLAHTILSRDDCDLLFLRSNKAIYDEATRRVLGDSDGTAAYAGGEAGPGPEVPNARYFDELYNSRGTIGWLCCTCRESLGMDVSLSHRKQAEFFDKNPYPAAMAEASDLLLLLLLLLLLIFLPSL